MKTTTIGEFIAALPDAEKAFRAWAIREGRTYLLHPHNEVAAELVVKKAHGIAERRKANQ